MVQQLSNLDFNNIARIVGLPDGIGNQEPATIAQLRSAQEAVKWKDSARVATAANIPLTAPGANIDGIVMAANDRVLVRAQTAATENGVYIWAGAAVPMVRSADTNTALELEQAIVSVEEGTLANATYRQTTVNFALGTGNVVWVSFLAGAPPASEATAGITEIATQAETDAGIDDLRIVTPQKLAQSPFRAKRFAADVGDGTATQYTLSHNLATYDVIAQVKRTSGARDVVGVDIDFPTINQVRVTFASAPALNAFRLVVLA